MYVSRDHRLEFLRGARSAALGEVDAATFEVLGSRLARDERRVFFEGELLSGVDPHALRVVNDEVFTDGERVFHLGVAMDCGEALDGPSFEHIAGPFYRDRRGVFCIWYAYDEYTCAEVGADRETFEPIAMCFGRDAERLFNHHLVQPDVCPASFEVVHPYFAKDADAVYFLEYGGKESDAVGVSRLHGADPHTFRVLDEAYARDQRSIYYFYNCGSLARRRHLNIECLRVETSRVEAFLPFAPPLEEQEMLPDAFDGERLFFRGRALPLAPEAFDVRVHDDGRASLLYVDLDQLQAYLEEHPGLSHEPASVEPGVSVSVDNTVVVEDGDDIPF